MLKNNQIIDDDEREFRMALMNGVQHYLEDVDHRREEIIKSHQRRFAQQNKTLRKLRLPSESKKM